MSSNDNSAPAASAAVSTDTTAPAATGPKTLKLSALDAEALSAHLVNYKLGGNTHLKKVIDVDNTTLYGSIPEITVEVGSMTGGETTQGIAFKNDGTNSLKFVVGNSEDKAAAFKVIAEALIAIIAGEDPESSNLAKTVENLIDKPDDDVAPDVKEKLLSLFNIEDEQAVGFAEMDSGVTVLKYDEKFAANTAEVKFFANARVRELYEDKGCRKSRAIKVFSASGTVAPDLNVAFVRMSLGFAISFPADSKPLLSMNMTTPFFILSKNEAAVSTEDMEIERALQAAGHSTGEQTGGASGGSSFEAPKKKMKFTLGKKKQ